MLQSSRNRSLHRQRLLKCFSDLKTTHSAIYLEGTQSSLRTPTSDVDNIFRQESNFWWVTGCNEADCAAVLSLEDGQFIMLVPELGDEYALWCGEYPSEEDYKKVLSADRVIYNKKENLNNLLKELKVEKLYTLRHTLEKVSFI